MAALRWIIAVAFFALFSPTRGAAEVVLNGRVADENNAPVADARITVRQASATAALAEAQSDPTGAFTLSLPSPGDYVVDVATELTLTINSVREVFQSVDVSAQTSSVELAATGNQSRLSGTEVNDIPYANSHSLRTGLQLLPEVVQDTTGQLHVNGASENQVLY